MVIFMEIPELSGLGKSSINGGFAIAMLTGGYGF